MLGTPLGEIAAASGLAPPELRDRIEQMLERMSVAHGPPVTYGGGAAEREPVPTRRVFRAALAADAQAAAEQLARARIDSSPVDSCGGAEAATVVGDREDEVAVARVARDVDALRLGVAERVRDRLARAPTTGGPQRRACATARLSLRGAPESLRGVGRLTRQRRTHSRRDHLRGVDVDIRRQRRTSRTKRVACSVHALRLNRGPPLHACRSPAAGERSANAGPRFAVLGVSLHHMPVRAGEARAAAPRHGRAARPTSSAHALAALGGGVRTARRAQRRPARGAAVPAGPGRLRPRAAARTRASPSATGCPAAHSSRRSPARRRRGQGVPRRRARRGRARPTPKLADLQDSMRPVEVGDAELRAGLAEVRELVADLGLARARVPPHVRAANRPRARGISVHRPGAGPLCSVWAAPYLAARCGFTFG